MKIVLKKANFFLLFVLSVLIILLINYYPSFYAKAESPRGMIFSGQSSLLDPWDLNVYVAAINWSQKYGLYFQNAYTTTSHKPIILYPLYTLLGIFFPAGNAFAIYQAMSICTAIIFITFTYLLIKKFVNKYLALLATNLALLGGGFGWYFFGNKFLSSDLVLTPLTFSSAFSKPHEMISLIFYFFALYHIFTAISKRSIKNSVISSFSLALSIIFYPYLLLTFFFISFIYAFFLYKFKLKSYQTLLIPLISSSILVLIYGAYLYSDENFFGVTMAILSKPNIFNLIESYGLLGIISLIQLFRIKKSKVLIFANIWFFTGVVASYLPISYSKYFLRGLFLPLSIISVFFIKKVSKKFNTDLLALSLAFLLISSLTSIYLFNLKLVSARNAGSRWVYLKREEVDAFEFLNKFTTSGSGILSTYIPGNFIPSYTYNRVYYGHNTQTPSSREKIDHLTKFYTNQMSESEAEIFLEENNVSYVYWGRDEKGLTRNSIKDYLDYKFLHPVFQNSEVVIYNIKHNRINENSEN